MKQAWRLRADLRTLIRRVTICPDVEPGFLQRLHPFSHSDFRIDVLFGFSRIQCRHIPGFQRGVFTDGLLIACERLEKASTGTPGISHIPCLPTTSVS